MDVLDLEAGMQMTHRWPLLIVASACLGVLGCQGNISDQLAPHPGDQGTGGSSSGTPGSGGGSTPTTGAGGSSTSGAGGSGSGTGTTGTGGSSTSCTPLTPVTRRLWRLSAAQWGAAVKDLLGLSAAPNLTSKGGEATFAFVADPSLKVDAPMMFDMFQQSQTVLTQIDPMITTLAPCSGTTSSAQTTCAQNFIQTLATKAYRRPLDSTEVPNLMKVYAQGAMTDYKTGVELMVQAVILSTSFVYRTELGPTTLTADSTGKYPDTKLTPYEVASQLSFTLLGSLPDAALTAAAADGSLGTSAGVSTQVARLLALPAVQANVTNIVLSWFNINQLFSKLKDTSLLSALSSAEQDQTAIQNDLLKSAQSWVNSILWQGSGKISDLMTSQTVYVNQRLATLFPGLTYSGGKAPTSDSTWVAATWPASQGRSGILTQPAYLWAASDPSLTSIVKRGRGIHDSIVCADPLPPPVDLSTPSAVNVIACKPPDGGTPLSACDSEVLQSDARMTYSPCKTCHAHMDSYSRMLLNFGPIGNYRTVDEAGDPITPTITFPAGSPLAGQTITGAQAFAQALAASGTFDGCSAQQMTSYALGEAISVYNTCELNTLRTQTDGTIKGLFTNVLLSDFARARTGGTK
jgi:hypothetical protein